MLDLCPPLVFLRCSTFCRLERVISAGLSSATRLFARLLSAGASFAGRTFVHHSSVPFCSTFCRLDRGLPAPSGARHNQSALLDRRVAVLIAADGDLDDAAYPTTNLFFPPLPYVGRSWGFLGRLPYLFPFSPPFCEADVVWTRKLAVVVQGSTTVYSTINLFLPPSPFAGRSWLFLVEGAVAPRRALSPSAGPDEEGGFRRSRSSCPENDLCLQVRVRTRKLSLFS